MLTIEKTDDESFDSVEAFLAECATTTGHDWADHAKEMIAWWHGKGGKLRSTRTGMMLDRVFPEAPTDLALLTLSVKGTGELGTLKLDRNHLLTTELLQQLRTMGFRGEKKLTYTVDELASGIASDVQRAVVMLDEAVPS